VKQRGKEKIKLNSRLSISVLFNIENIGRNKTAPILIISYTVIRKFYKNI